MKFILRHFIYILFIFFNIKFLYKINIPRKQKENLVMLNCQPRNHYCFNHLE